MAVLDLESLLKPVAEDAPCGRDLEYDPPFLALQELARGKPEQVIGDKVRAALEPPWSNVRAAAEQLFATTKDLRVAGILHLALIKTAGIAGMEGGLNLMSAMLGRYWDGLYPLLDAEDDNDPTFRVNSLIAAVVSDDALATLRQAAIVESKQFGKHSLRAWRIANGTIKVEPVDGQDTDPAQLRTRMDAAFTDTPLEALSATAALIDASLEHLNAIQHILLDKADGIPEDLKSLASDLKEMKTLVDGHLTRRGGGSSAAGADDMAAQSDQDGEAPVVGGAPGAIRNRTDVIATLERICDYYAKAEPSSPVPMLLQRAKRLVNKDFMEIIRDLTPNAISEAEVIGGLEKRDS
ncbi:MAG TPA: type VI secretion system protein TssA [Steroidobacteraceae bacterium]|jgi:type VI secretion system protein ImpA